MLWFGSRYIPWSLSALDLCNMQYVKNSLSRIDTNTTESSHIDPVRKNLYWLLQIAYSKYFELFVAI